MTARPFGWDRPVADWLWYRFVQQAVGQFWMIGAGLRASGRGHVPRSGGAILVANHLSYLDVFMLGLLMPRSLNYVARAGLFVGPLAGLIRSVGGFPIQTEGVGAQGVKEILRRLKNGSLVTFFPEGTRSEDGQLGPLKPGMSVLVTRARVPVVPIGLAGTFEAWPRRQALPRFHPVHVHYGPAILPGEFQGLDPGLALDLIKARMAEARTEAHRRLERAFPGHQLRGSEPRRAGAVPAAPAPAATDSTLVAG